MWYTSHDADPLCMHMYIDVYTCVLAYTCTHMYVYLYIHVEDNVVNMYCMHVRVCVNIQYIYIRVSVFSSGRRGSLQDRKVPIVRVMLQAFA